MIGGRHAEVNINRLRFRGLVDAVDAGSKAVARRNDGSPAPENSQLTSPRKPVALIEHAVDEDRRIRVDISGRAPSLTFVE